MLEFVQRHPRGAVPQVQSTLAKLSRCRTAALGWHKLKCSACEHYFVIGLKRLHATGRIAFDPPQLPGVDEPDFAEWLDRIAEQAWNVFIEGPPAHSQPAHMVKYLARYLTGGPISDGRLISHDSGMITFWARSKNKTEGNKPRPFPLSGVEFMRRWSLHILPKGFTKTRSYGGFTSEPPRDVRFPQDQLAGELREALH